MLFHGCVLVFMAGDHFKLIFMQAKRAPDKHEI